jgi:hypothetical protein
MSRQCLVFGELDRATVGLRVEELAKGMEVNESNPFLRSSFP